MEKYVLPELPYDYSALEPHISGRIMELHHDKHHGTYVKNANRAVERLDEARSKEALENVGSLERSLAFNLSGHVLHSLFWKNLSPKAGGPPTGELAEQIRKDFGGFDRFQKLLNATASTLMGSGWGALVWEPVGKRLQTVQIYDHQSNIAQSGIPIMVLDAWEHAFYLQYENRKTDYFEASWKLWNWQDIARRFEAARAAGPALPAGSRGKPARPKSA
ncbi:MAG: superoxide dismutase, partial [Candidatus Eiseniibacteriota bacterium]